MKKVIVLAIGLVSMFTTIHAQQTAALAAKKEKLTTEQRAQKNVDELDKIVTLSADQKAKVKELALTRIGKADAVRGKYKGQADSKEAIKKELAPARSEYKQAVRAILTPEQLTKDKEAKKAAKANKVSALDGTD